MRKVVVVALLATVIAGGYTLGEAHRLRAIGPGAPYVRLYRGATRGLEASMATGDGQAYGALAQDPTLARPEVFAGGSRAAAYRYQRPMLGYLAWMASLGRPGWEPNAQALLVVLGAAIAAAACAELLRRRGRNPLLALFVLFTPGMLSSLSTLTAEPIALAFLTIGLLLWWDDPRRVTLAAICFSLAALSRETSLVAVVALGVGEAFRRAGRERWSWLRRVAPLAAPFAVYAGWLTVVRVRLGAWPFAAREGRLSRIPFGGLVHDMSSFADPRSTWFWLAAALVLVVFAVVKHADPLSCLVLGYGIFSAALGMLVWNRWQDFGRPLLPLYAYGLLIVMTRITRPEPVPA